MRFTGWFSFLFWGGGHPQRDLGNALADATDCVQAAFVFPKLIALRLHCAAPMISRTPVANEDHLLGKHEHYQLLQNQFQSSVASSANGDGAANFVLQREAPLSKSCFSGDETIPMYTGEHIRMPKTSGATSFSRTPGKSSGRSELLEPTAI